MSALPEDRTEDRMDIFKEKIQGKAVAFVDGSFNPDIQKYAYGCVLFHPDGFKEELCGSGDTPEAVSQRNVAGEMIASMLSVKWAIINGYDSLDIYYDYAGIEMWVTGEWKAKNELTKKYRDTMRSWGNRVKLSFNKVEAHKGNIYNEEADKLAKAGLLKPCGLPEIVKLNQK